MMEKGTAMAWASTVLCLSRAKAPAALGKPHPLVAQPICFSGIRKRDGNETEFLAIPPQASLQLHIPHWAYPLLLAECRRHASPAQKHHSPFLIPHSPINAP